MRFVRKTRHLGKPAAPSQVSVAHEVLRYLSSHPNAADTFEGILNWWLPRQRYETERRRIEMALEQLVMHQLVAKRRLADGSMLYSRRKRLASGSDEKKH
jgi:hypothetical protein